MFFYWMYSIKNENNTRPRAIIGQRGTLPVMPLGYLNFKKVIFRTMQTMRKQFPVVPRTTHWCVEVLTGKCRQIQFGKMESQKRLRSDDNYNDTSVSKKFPWIAIPIRSETKEAVKRLLSERKKKVERVEIKKFDEIQVLEKLKKCIAKIDENLHCEVEIISGHPSSTVVCFSIQRGGDLSPKPGKSTSEGIKCTQRKEKLQAGGGKAQNFNCFDSQWGTIKRAGGEAYWLYKQLRKRTRSGKGGLQWADEQQPGSGAILKELWDLEREAFFKDQRGNGELTLRKY